MKIKKLSPYITGFAIGVFLTIIIDAWGEIAVAWRIVYIALLGLLLFAAWFKQKSHNSNNNTDNEPRHIFVGKPSNKSSDNAS